MALNGIHQLLDSCTPGFYGIAPGVGGLVECLLCQLDCVRVFEVAQPAVVDCPGRGCRQFLAAGKDQPGAAALADESLAEFQDSLQLPIGFFVEDPGPPRPEMGGGRRW